MYMKYTVNTSSLQYRTCFAIPQVTTEGATYLLPKTNRMLTATTTMAIPRVKIHLVESVEKETLIVSWSFKPWTRSVFKSSVFTYKLN
jgi:hypothetical protein